MLLMEDIKDDRKDDRGKVSVWRLEEERWKKEAEEAAQPVDLMGLYLTQSAAIVQLIIVKLIAFSPGNQEYI